MASVCQERNLVWNTILVAHQKTASVRMTQLDNNSCLSCAGEQHINYV